MQHLGTREAVVQVAHQARVALDDEEAVGWRPQICQRLGDGASAGADLQQQLGPHTGDLSRDGLRQRPRGRGNGPHPPRVANPGQCKR
jgi:hypothetical protein